jgi:membrane-associated phospholipid phosphatase
MSTNCTDAAYRHPGPSWLVQVLIGLAVTAALVTVAYLFVDLPVMDFVCERDLIQYRFLKGLTRPPEVFVTLSPFVFFAGLLRRRFTPWNRVEKVAVAAAASTLVTALVTGILKISFGRAGPTTLAYGFQPFHLEPAYWAFPSGHTACTLSVMAVVRVAAPRWRLCGWSVAGMVAVALIARNDHFVGDVLGGAFLGWAIGGTVARLLGIKALTITEPGNAPEPATTFISSLLRPAR